MREFPLDNVREAIQDLTHDFGEAYPLGIKYLGQLDRLETARAELLPRYDLLLNDPTTFLPTDRQLYTDILTLVRQFDELRQSALTSNPLLDWEHLLLVRRTPHGDPRRAMGRGYGVSEYLGYPRQSSKCNPGIEQPLNWQNDICLLSPTARDGELTTLYQPEDKRLLKDLDLDWDGQRILFSMPGSHDKWQVFRIDADGTGLRQLTPTDQPDIHFYDACWLPSGEIAHGLHCPTARCALQHGRYRRHDVQNECGRNRHRATGFRTRPYLQSHRDA